MLSGKCVVVGVTGGIAAYKTCEVVSRLKKLHADVRVIMTKNATEFVSPLTFQSLSHNPVSVDTFANIQTWEIEHIALAQRADVFVIAPATANIIGKLACGIADDMLSTTVMATHAPVLIAPAMNTAMLENAATQQNMRTLSERGMRFIAPGTGMLACGTSGAGRMSEPSQIVDEIVRTLRPREDFAGLSVVVTAGPTAEPLDPVRYITNRSSGKMGYAIAEAAAARGARVLLASGPVNLNPPKGVELISVESSKELCAAVLSHADEADIVIQAAAPADFTPETVADQKIKKTGSDLALRLVPTTDIARELGSRKRPGQILVAFAAETERLIENAKRKLEKKNADLVVANDVTRPGAGFGGNTNIVSLVTRDSAEELPIMPKSGVADAILDRVARLMERA